MTFEQPISAPRSGARMVDVGSKPITARMARASALVRMHPQTAAAIRDRALPKGDVLETARLAGIMAAKHTAQWIPLCHPLPLDAVAVELSFLDDSTLEIRSEVHATARTGVEMEALVAVTAAALTVYDMCKAMERAMVIERVWLEEKAGGKSGHFRRENG